jgi:hypothetical protein
MNLPESAPTHLWTTAKLPSPIGGSYDRVSYLIPADPLVGGSHDAGDTDQMYPWIPTSVVSGHRQISGIMNTPQQGPSAGVDSASLENGDAERPPSASNSLHSRTSKWDPRPTTGQALQPSRETPPIKMCSRS